MATVGLLHPGEMGAGFGGVLVRCGHTVHWAAEGRSADTRRRAGREGLTELPDVAALVAASEVVLSIAPPHAALDVAGQVAGFTGLYCDANAVSPGRSAEIAEVIERAGGRYVDGGIIGSPPPGRPRLCLSGEARGEMASLFTSDEVVLQPLDGDAFAASAMKMCYAAVTKGRSALLLAVRALARATGVEGALVAEWEKNSPEVISGMRAAARSAEDRGWRWIGEMAEIADTFRAAGLPGGFHEASQEIYARAPRGDGPATDETLDRVVEALLSGD